MNNDPKLAEFPDALYDTSEPALGNRLLRFKKRVAEKAVSDFRIPPRDTVEGIKYQMALEAGLAALETPVESPSERAAHAGLLVVADFYIAILQSKSVDEALLIRQLIAEVLASMESAERAALEKADSLCGAKS